MQKKWISYVMVVLGGALTALPFGIIILPQGFAAAGVTGLAVLICEVIPLDVASVVLAINLLLLLLALLLVGKDFFAKTIIVSILFPVLLGQFEKIPYFTEFEQDPLLSSILAGAVMGLGSGLILRGNGSGGGFDVLAVILHQRYQISIPVFIYCCNLVIVVSYAILSQSLLKTIYGIVVSLTSNIVLNYILTYGRPNGKILIFSQQYEKIRQELLLHQDVGMTFLAGETGFLRQDTKVIITVMPRKKIETVKQCVLQIDPAAFLLVDTARSVCGRGYTIER